MESCYIETPLGYAKIVGNQDGITSVSIVDTTENISESIPESLLDCVTQLKAYFNNELKTFELKLNPEGTDFQKKVWKQLEKIPFGKTISYLDLAKQLGDAKTIRAAASANGKNPLWIIVPCHRVIGTDGSLTGYAGGLHRKQWLLNHESKYKQQRLF
ncbi:methylated-DNA--[protein]-cysteine S-methyltransferase [Winogradskyella sp. SYSU M77433]|uniref:methylated-DNA--[protein]-cysteine S-methyltransferase n=1 Tax=Winogradskyella sp. SYSU M77433 TaxID=3042722 RepID=UPI0024813137|nr:methylated-DNA--[protein]-cysteine S-methyltransferase [Winogradskyella sp. SYSU M77433]MDH7913643.1 methylated-DNA--[protein]-cysteine S-methyltransferase [Winogradskyella sp. SYSU M77433]